MAIEYTDRERLALWSIAVMGVAGLNGVFMYAAVMQPGMVQAALSNPVSLAFILEAFLLVGMLAYLLGRWGVSRLSWGWFVALCLFGGIAFALPVAVFWKRRSTYPAGAEPWRSRPHLAAGDDWCDAEPPRLIGARHALF